jgi:hypothetical protein
MPDPGFGGFVASHHAFVVPTLAVLHTLCQPGHAASVAGDPRLADGLPPPILVNLSRGYPALRVKLGCEPASAAIAQLLAAGVPILAGTDAPNPGTAHGATMHEELALLVAAGMSPSQALTAATAAPAAAFHLDDRGRIAIGRRADLVLVDGDPTEDIRATRAIVGVWRAGVPFDRPAYLAARKAERAAEARRLAEAPARIAAGLVSDFDDGTVDSRFGTGWEISTDDIAGGSSSATMAVVPGGAGGSRYALSIEGTIAADSAFPWAGVAFKPGAADFAPVDLSSKRALRFFARGDGQTYRLMFFTASNGFRPLVATFVVGAEWRAIDVELGTIAGLSTRDVTMLLIAGGPASGRFALQVDNLRFE